MLKCEHGARMCHASIAVARRTAYICSVRSDRLSAVRFSATPGSLPTACMSGHCATTLVTNPISKHRSQHNKPRSYSYMLRMGGPRRLCWQARHTFNHNIPPTPPTVDAAGTDALCPQSAMFAGTPFQSCIQQRIKTPSAASPPACRWGHRQ